MSRDADPGRVKRFGFPRVSGDEPRFRSGLGNAASFSPRERG